MALLHIYEAFSHSYAFLNSAVSPLTIVSPLCLKTTASADGVVSESPLRLVGRC